MPCELIGSMTTPSEVAPAMLSRVEESVAHVGFGDEVPGLGVVGFELAAEMGHVDSQIVALLAVAGTPNVLEQLTLADACPRPRNFASSLPNHRLAKLAGTFTHPSRGHTGN